MNIGIGVKLLRTRRKLSQPDLAYKACIPNGYVSNLENGREINDPSLLRLQYALGVNRDVLTALSLEVKDFPEHKKQEAQELLEAVRILLLRLLS